MAANTSDSVSKLLSSLYRFRSHLQSRERNVDVLEAFSWFKENGQKGENCTFAQKSRKLFLQTKYDETKQQFLDILKIFREIEGEDFGK